MLNESVLNSFQFPEGALESMQQANMQQVQIKDGVSRFFSGSDKGVAYRFFRQPIYNETKSKLAGYEVFDEIEIIEWLTDKFCHPTEQVRFLPEGLLNFDKLTGKVTGRYADSYERFKKGLAAPGTALSRWGVLSDGEVASLAANGIFTVEQFAELTKDRVQSKFPKNFVEAYDRAVLFVNGKTNRIDADKHAAEMLELSQQNAKLKDEIEAIKATLAQKAATEVKKPRGRPHKEVEETEGND